MDQEAFTKVKSRTYLPKKNLMENHVIFSNKKQCWNLNMIMTHPSDQRSKSCWRRGYQSSRLCIDISAGNNDRIQCGIESIQHYWPRVDCNRNLEWMSNLIPGWKTSICSRCSSAKRQQHCFWQEKTHWKARSNLRAIKCYQRILACFERGQWTKTNPKGQYICNKTVGEGGVVL